MTVYIAGGFPRTGTSLIMQILIELGLDPHYSESREKKMQAVSKRRNYPINKHGFWEVGSAEWSRLGMTSEIPARKCVKIQAWGWLVLAPGRHYKIIATDRDTNDIRKSYIKSFGEEEFNERFNIAGDWPTYYHNLLGHAKGVMSHANNVELITVKFNDLFDKTEEAVRLIAAFINRINEEKIMKAIDCIKPELRRFNGND